ncbi:ABC transporter permease [bacterium]|nr:ABC transporter permease [bacterium]
MKINILHVLRIVRFGGKNLWLHKLRSFLTMLGIVFGVASVIAMLAIGEGASFEAKEIIKALGSNNIIIRSLKPPSDATTQTTSWLDVYGLTPSDFMKILSIPSIENIVPAWEINEEIWRLAKNTPGRVVGTTPDYAETTNMKVEAGGRFINKVDMDTSKSVVVIGSSIKNILFLGVNPIGEKIKIKSNYFTVIGVVKAKVFSKGTGSFEADDINFDVYLPLTTARAYFGEFNVKMRTRQASWVKFHRFIAKVKDTNKIMSTSALINHILESTHKNPDYEILVPLDLLKQEEHRAKIFSIVLGSIAAISLIVGGIGIMNIMLATVTERTREIGIRRALGAKRRDIIYQFVTEAVILSAAGGFIGVLVGVIIPQIVSKFAGMATIVTLWSVLIAFFISVAIGLTFGIYPARKAALLDPIEALRYE